MTSQEILRQVQSGELDVQSAAAMLSAANGNGKPVKLERRAGVSQRTGKPYSGWRIHGNHPPCYVSEAVLRSIAGLTDEISESVNGKTKARE